MESIIMKSIMKKLWFISIVLFALSPVIVAGPFQATGIKIGEVDQNSAIIWTRLTEDKVGDVSFVNAAPGSEGMVRVTYWPEDNQEDIIRSSWRGVDKNKDFTRQIEINRLKTNTHYSVRVEARPMVGKKVTSTIKGSFVTAPKADTVETVQFIVVTCQAIISADCGDNGHSSYKLMPLFKPDFFVHTGDIVYYDKPPLCKDMISARFKWNRMYAYGYNRDFHSDVASYFMKDDHDTLKNDCWAGQKYGDLTWDQGLAIFREQVPMGEKTYRTYRWGKDLQIWLTENRDFRSPNNMPDGPDKTIWGREQMAWFKKTVAESNATFKILIMPGPLIGPDKKGKADNHANANFRYEGDVIRKFIAEQDNMFVINGDRHWQYYSVDPRTGIHEFGCGPINDMHMYGGNPGEVSPYHKYFGAKGGFLGVTIERKNDQPQATIQYFAGNPTTAKAGELKVNYKTTLKAK